MSVHVSGLSVYEKVSLVYFYFFVIYLTVFIISVVTSGKCGCRT